MRVFYLLTTLCLTASVSILAGCGTSPPTKYYLLSSGAEELVPGPAQRELVVGVGPVTLPSYLDRREMVSRTGSNELNVAALHQWAEPLQENFARVLGEDLGRRLGTDQIIRLPAKRFMRRALRIDYQVVIGVERFERMPDGGAVLDVRWMILDNDNKLLLLSRSAHKQMPPADSYAGQVAAQSQLLGRLGEEIAAAIEGLMETQQQESAKAH